jgi:3-deoxy-D-manno-octulosonate 8-phosphate phosphatase (KDO 8-P phosphatase)
LSRVEDGVVERASRIRWIVLDSDGVLTDGTIVMSSDGSEARSFHVRDGMGIRLGQKAGLDFGIISGRESAVLTARARELDIEELHQQVVDKWARLSELLARHGLDPEAVCFVGDDVNDVPVMQRVGLAAAPADAATEARAAAHYVTRVEGGRGCVREVIDLVLRAQGRLDPVLRDLFGGTPAAGGADGE